jgi:hypothetical protein
MSSGALIFLCQLRDYYKITIRIMYNNLTIKVFDYYDLHKKLSDFFVIINDDTSILLNSNNEVYGDFLKYVISNNIKDYSIVII